MNKTTLDILIHGGRSPIINGVDVTLDGQLIGQLYVDDSSDDGDSETVFDLILNNKVVSRFTESPDLESVQTFVTDCIHNFLRK